MPCVPQAALGRTKKARTPPTPWVCVQSVAGALQQALPHVDVVADLTHRQPIQCLLPGAGVKQRGALELGWIEKIGEVANSVREINQPILKGPLGNIGTKPEAEGDVGRAARVERRLDIGRLLRHGYESHLDLLAGLLLEGSNDFRYCLVLLGVVRLLPRHDEVGTARA
jgi:hypothetical protein